MRAAVAVEIVQNAGKDQEVGSNHAICRHLDEIIDIITRSLSDSRMTDQVILEEVMSNIEEKVGHKFNRTARFIPRTVR